jgi:hypothetical protein
VVKHTASCLQSFIQTILSKVMHAASMAMWAWK